MGYTREQREANANRKNNVEKIAKDVSATVNIEQKPSSITAKKIKRQLPLNTLVEVKNGFNGKLIYKSKKTIGMTIIFETFGDSEYIELEELVSARNSSRKYFENNWFLIDDQEVIEFLGVQKYYENAFNIETFDEIFDMTPSEIESKVKQMSKGQKNTLIYRSIEFIDNGTIDSRKTIEALEKALEVELVEH